MYLKDDRLVEKQASSRAVWLFRSSIRLILFLYWKKKHPSFNDLRSVWARKVHRSLRMRSSKDGDSLNLVLMNYGIWKLITSIASRDRFPYPWPHLRNVPQQSLLVTFSGLCQCNKPLAPSRGAPTMASYWLKWPLLWCLQWPAARMPTQASPEAQSWPWKGGTS